MGLQMLSKTFGDGADVMLRQSVPQSGTGDRKSSTAAGNWSINMLHVDYHLSILLLQSWTHQRKDKGRHSSVHTL